jgi:hypothetical protein
VPSGAALASTTFADDTMGILAYVAYKRSDTTTNQVFIPCWIGNYFYQCQSQPACQTSDFTPAKKNVLGWFPQQLGANQVNTKDERVDGRLAYQWRPSDKVLLTWTAISAARRCTPRLTATARGSTAMTCAT